MGVSQADGIPVWNLPTPHSSPPASSHNFAPMLPSPVGRRHGQRIPKSSSISWPNMAPVWQGQEVTPPERTQTHTPHSRGEFGRGTGLCLSRAAGKAEIEDPLFLRPRYSPTASKQLGELDRENKDFTIISWNACVLSVKHQLCNRDYSRISGTTIALCSFLECLKAALTAPRPWDVGAEGILGIL